MTELTQLLIEYLAQIGHTEAFTEWLEENGHDANLVINGME